MTPGCRGCLRALQLDGSRSRNHKQACRKRFLEIFRNNLTGDEISLRKRNDAYARSISILHVLQTSLDFENGEEIADNLFLLYEFARLQLLETFRSGEISRIDTAINSLQEISQAWDQMDRSALVDRGM